MPSKRCPKCKEIRDASQYYKGKNRKDGLDGICIPCRKTPEFRARASFMTRLSIYKLAESAYNEMYEAQRGLCAACGELPNHRGLYIDHDHKTGKVRGLLCQHCNTALGMLKDSPDKILGLYAYIKGGE